MILKSLVVGPIGANCYVIGDEATNEGAIIDPGDDAQRIIRMVKDTGLTIQFIIATHGHFDHNGAMKVLKEEYDCDFLLHKDDLMFIKQSKKSAMKWGITIEQVPYPDKYVEDGDILKLGSLELTVIHTPGHSRGGICLYIPSEKLVFSGDTLFYGSVGRTDFDGGSMEELLKSIKEKLYTLPDNTVVYTGHGEETTIGNEKMQNMFVR